VAAAHAGFERYATPIEAPGALQLAEVVATLRDTLPDDAIITNGAGNYTAWVHRFFRYRRFRTQLAPTSGSMGYGLPAAVAAALADSGRPVICFAGDGCFMMTCQEFATAAHYGARLVVLLVNNGMLGTIRMHQERAYPGRVMATDLKNPDFPAMARAMGGLGERITTTEAFGPALARALAHDGPALIEIKLDRRALSPTTQLPE